MSGGVVINMRLELVFSVESSLINRRKICDLVAHTADLMVLKIPHSLLRFPTFIPDDVEQDGLIPLFSRAFKEL